MEEKSQNKTTFPLSSLLITVANAIEGLKSKHLEITNTIARIIIDDFTRHIFLDRKDSNDKLLESINDLYALYRDKIPENSGVHEIVKGING